MADGFDELHKLEVDLSAAPAAALPLIKKAIGISALKGKRAWQAAAAGHKYSGSYPASIDYDPVGNDLETELGPNFNRSRGVAGLGIVEDSPGGVNGAPQRNYVKAEEVIAPDLERGIEIAIDQTLKGLGL
jgi:hypothetical protein